MVRIAMILTVITGCFTIGAASRSCQPCETNGDCAAAYEYCAKEAGACAERGVCEPMPEGCTEEYAPVCGCDGNTYSNACFAASAGVNADYEGECEPDYCWSNRECEVSEYCFFDTCAAETGQCKPRPTICPDVWAPVCGCDEVTYGNACEAAQEGMSIAHEGSCENS